MRIWIDILTPKELLFFEPIIEKIGKNNEFLCTSRRYGEVEKLARIRRFDLAYVGRYGGKSKRGKLRAGIRRMARLEGMVAEFAPDLLISFCSPDAARVGYGLGIRHVAFSDSPHHVAGMRLTLPLVQHLLTPRVIPKKEFTIYGIDKKDILQYDAIDAAALLKRDAVLEGTLPFKEKTGRNILIRVEEEESAYASRSDRTMPMLGRIIDDFGGENIVVLARYQDQARDLRERLGGSAQVIRMSFDGKALLERTDVFVGSGGTMTAEAGLMGIPTISYGAAPNAVEKYLIKKRIIMKESDPGRISRMIKRSLDGHDAAHRRMVREVVESMEDPIERLAALIKTIM